jgi:hypothetical protein
LANVLAEPEFPYVALWPLPIIMANVNFEQWFRQAHPRRPVHYDLVFVSLKEFSFM